MPHPAQRDALRLQCMNRCLVIMDRLGYGFIFERGAQARACLFLHRNGQRHVPALAEIAIFLAGAASAGGGGEGQHAALRLVHFFFVFVGDHGRLSFNGDRQRIF